MQFIDGRLAKLNAGRGFSDVFEEEITSGGFSGGKPVLAWPSIFRVPVTLPSALASDASRSINSFFLLNVRRLRCIFSPSKSCGIDLLCLTSVVQGVRWSSELVLRCPLTANTGRKYRRNVISLYLPAFLSGQYSLLGKQLVTATTRTEVITRRVDRNII